MNGQWSGVFQDGALTATLRVDLEDRGRAFIGNAYLFYLGTPLPGFQFPIKLEPKAPFRTTVNAVYLYPSGGVMTMAERQTEETKLQQIDFAPFQTLQLQLRVKGTTLTIDWSIEDGRAGTVNLMKSNTRGASSVESRADLKTWEDFRAWAVKQSPRHYIFRGQRRPQKLVSSFHRTWRKDLHSWITDDAQRLYGAVADQLSFPLQMGNLHHNAAIWSIMQHHGYPTPMIDWSLSPFVAAYFAFEAADQRGSAPRIYIFNQDAWNERYGRTNFIVDSAPDQLVVLESMAVANPRHVPQQALTTVTNVADVESFIRRKEVDDGVTYLTVIDLDADKRSQIMRELELMGITHGSLFPGLDGICRDMKNLLFAEPPRRADMADSNRSSGRTPPRA